MSGASDRLERLAHDRVGKTLRGKLRLDSVLGVGGCAAVYATTHRTGKRYAVKLLHPQFTFDLQMRERFFREAYVVNRIEHPGVVGVMDDDVDDDGSLFFVMELLAGSTVEELAGPERSGLPVDDVIGIAEQTLDVLVAAHALGIVHRDLKPANLFVTTDGEVKVLDFGIARLLELRGRTLATKTGTVMGTPGYMPPEQARGHVEQIGPRSDLWALGAVMFALLTGRLVHQARTANELLLAAMTGHAPPLREVWPDVGSELAAIVDRALAYEREARWQSAAAMLAAVRALRARGPHPPNAALSGAGAVLDRARTTVSGQRVGRIASSEEVTGVHLGTVSPFSATEALGGRALEERVSAALDEGDEVNAFIRRGFARMTSDDMPGAIADFTSALERDRGSVAAYYNRGVARQLVGNIVGASVDYGDAIARMADLPEAYFNRALCRREIDDLAGARKDAATALRLYEAAELAEGAEAARKLARGLGVK